jgi:hypothetical protein
MFFSCERTVPQKKQKKVSFYSLVDVRLIPCRFEYRFLTDELWWSETDYRNFYQSYRQEINNFSKIYPNITLADVRRLLYQPYNYMPMNIYGVNL